MTCSLTDSGRHLVEWYVDRVRSGTASPNRYYLEDNGGFVLLGEGNHRVVYGQSLSAEGTDDAVFSDQDCVVKLAKFDDPWANRNEIINHEFAPDGVAQFLAPVHEWADDGQWLLMDRAKMGVSPSERDWIEEEIQARGYQLDDIRTDNMGYIDGNPYIVDYGFRLIKSGTDLPEEYRDGKPEHVGPPGEEFFEPSISEKQMAELFG